MQGCHYTPNACTKFKEIWGQKLGQDTTNKPPNLPRKEKKNYIRWDYKIIGSTNITKIRMDVWWLGSLSGG